MKILITLLFATQQVFALDSLPLTQVKSGELYAKILNKEVLENVSASKGWIINGVAQPAGFDADLAVARRKIVCSFYIPSQKLESDVYVLQLKEHYEINAHHLEMTDSKKLFGITCFKNSKLSIMTLDELNQAYKGLIEWQNLHEPNLN